MSLAVGKINWKGRLTLFLSVSDLFFILFIFKTSYWERNSKCSLMEIRRVPWRGKYDWTLKGRIGFFFILLWALAEISTLYCIAFDLHDLRTRQKLRLRIVYLIVSKLNGTIFKFQRCFTICLIEVYVPIIPTKDPTINIPTINTNSNPNLLADLSILR